MKISEHMLKQRGGELRKAAKHERELAKNDRSTAGRLNELKKAAKAKEMNEDDEMTVPSTLVDYLHAQADARDSHADELDGCADECDALLEECSKAIAAADLSKSERIVPDNVRGVTTGVTMVLRAGQRHIERTEVPLELDKVLSLDDLGE